MLIKTILTDGVIVIGDNVADLITLKRSRQILGAYLLTE